MYQFSSFTLEKKSVFAFVVLYVCSTSVSSSPPYLSKTHTHTHAHTHTHIHTLSTYYHVVNPHSFPSKSRRRKKVRRQKVFVKNAKDLLLFLSQKICCFSQVKVQQIIKARLINSIFFWFQNWMLNKHLLFKIK